MKIPDDSLTEGDIIRHEGDVLQVYSPPEYLTRGIVFDALSLKFRETGQTQEVCLIERKRRKRLKHRSERFRANSPDDAIASFEPRSHPHLSISTIDPKKKNHATRTLSTLDGSPNPTASGDEPDR